MKVREVSNFYFFKLDTFSLNQLNGVYLLVGSAGFPSEPRPVMEPATDQFGGRNYNRGEDNLATKEKRIQAARKFVSKNNVYKYMTIEDPFHIKRLNKGELVDHLRRHGLPARGRKSKDELISLYDSFWADKAGHEQDELLNAIGGEIGHEERWGSFITWSSIVSPETKDDVPLRIGDRKTGPGNYYFLGKNLYLAESGDDVLKHVIRNTEPTENKAPTRERIPDETQIFVWNRDGGSCVKCGSIENLAFDHIIPHSLGGSNSRRNLQLLCDPCNLKKSNKIGG